MEQTKILAICGIDTGVGKSVATGLMAGALLAEGQRVMTMKIVQTGCEGRPGDILLHRRLMGSAWTEADEQGLSCPYCFPFPASPHLAARLAGGEIEPNKIDQATGALARGHDLLLIEGAGGLLVPLRDDLLLLDYLAARHYPLVLVTSPRLGSINHTLLSLEAIRSRNVPFAGLVYNLFGDTPAEIVRDTLVTLKAALARYGLARPVVLLPDTRESTTVNWKPLLST